jgi:uncharacterized protein YjbI with pentapeptide repeats
MDDDGKRGKDSDLILSGAATLNRYWNQNPGEVLDFRKIEVDDSDLSGVLLKNANLSGAIFRNCNLTGGNFDGARLSNTAFVRCDLRKSTIRATDLATTTISDSILDGSDFSGSAGFSQIKEISTCCLRDRTAEVRFDLSRCRRLDRLLSWSRIRVLGQLRLFVPSYFALSTSILVMTALGFVNERLESTRNLISNLSEAGLIANASAERLLVALQPLHSSWRHAAVLLSSLAIATASTMYLFCPSKVREFTLEQWKFLGSQSAFEYEVKTWAMPRVRLWCVTAYCVGGGIAFVLLANTFLSAIKLVLADFNF